MSLNDFESYLVRHEKLTCEKGARNERFCVWVLAALLLFREQKGEFRSALLVLWQGT